MSVRLRELNIAPEGGVPQCLVLILDSLLCLAQCCAAGTRFAFPLCM
jgi:hypothetical protein